MTPLAGHTSPETAYAVNGRRWWLETSRHGQRLVSQSVKGRIKGRSYYLPQRTMWLDDAGVVQTERPTPGDHHANR